MTTRLIERWLPIAELSEEATRERRSMTALPAIYYLHVWWARRPLVASRAAVLASILPDDADHEAFSHALGIHGDPLAAKVRIAIADRRGERLGADAYGYRRAFTFTPSEAEMKKLLGDKKLVVLDPTAGGGSIPFEAMRLGVSVHANDLNPVAATILKGTIEYPALFGDKVVTAAKSLGAEWGRRVKDKLGNVFPDEPRPGDVPDGYLWARTITCPYCSGKVPLSPNWRLAPSGTGVRLVPQVGEGVGDAERRCTFEIVQKAAEQSPGTVAGGDGVCPFPDCGRPISGEEIKRQAQAGSMGDQLYAVVFKTPVTTETKTGRKKSSWQRGYRAPSGGDDNTSLITELLQERIPEWEALDVIPTEQIPEGSKTDEARRFGATSWRDMFSPRQLLIHCTNAAVFAEMYREDEASGELDDVRKAAYVYTAFAIDKLLNYNSRMSIWMSTREVVANTFNRHDFAFCWSYAELASMVEGSGVDWAVANTTKALKELTATIGGGQVSDLIDRSATSASTIAISNGSGANMPHHADKSVDAIVMDPPYGANVMYAELSDFFYVWLKRTAGLVVPELFTRRLADKETEAVANKAHFKGQKGAEKLANRDYQDKMAGIFAECRRVLKDDGIMTVMFTHKDTGAWDALAMSLMDAGFVITASWPVNTEASGSLHIKDKAAANSTIFLVCRPRLEQGGEASSKSSAGRVEDAAASSSISACASS